MRNHLVVLGGHTLDLTGLTARNRRLIVLGARGADGDTPEPLTALLERAADAARSELTDEDLEELRSELRERAVELAEDPTAASDDDLAALEQIRVAVEAISTDISAREQASNERAERARDLLQSISGEDGGDGEGDAGDGDGAGADGEGDAGDGAGEGTGGDGADGGDGAGEGDGTGDAGDGAGEGGEGDGAGTQADDDADRIAASAAGATTPVVVRTRGADVTAPRTRRGRAPRNAVLRASANVPGLQAGAILRDDADLARAFLRTIRATRGYRGPRIEVPVASFGSDEPIDMFGAERTLDGDVRGNAAKIDAVTGLPALRAAGGVCAPPPINYDQPTIGTNARPVMGSMVARFGADRGGVTTLPPPHLTDLAGAITVWTEANDVTPSSPATKNCLTLTCMDEETTMVDAIVQCLEIGNYRARYFPEQIRAWTTKASQASARVAETKMLTEIGDGSTQVDVPTVLGTTRTVLGVMDRAGAQIRSRHRLELDYPLRVGFPGWLLDNMITDLSREQPGATAERLATSDAEINAWFAARQMNVTWFLDGETGQIYGAQADGDLLGWASHVIGYMYPEGQWLGLDGGGENFGIVRDSTLNSTNDFQLFSEIFEATHQIEIADSYRLDIDICPDGTTSAAKTISVCAGSS